MKKLLLLVSAIALTLFTACGGGGAKTPSEKAIEMMGYIQDGDYTAYVDNLYADKGKELKAEEKAEFVSMLEAKGTQLQEKEGGIKGCEVLEEKISEDGNSATVKMKVLYGNGGDEKSTLKMVKGEDGQWLCKLK